MLKIFKRKTVERIYLNKTCLGKLYSTEGFRQLKQILDNAGIKILKKSSRDVTEQNRWFEISSDDINLLKLTAEIKTFNDVFNEFIKEFKENPNNFKWCNPSKYSIHCISSGLVMWVNEGRYHFDRPEMRNLSKKQIKIFDDLFQKWDNRKNYDFFAF